MSSVVVGCSVEVKLSVVSTDLVDDSEIVCVGDVVIELLVSLSRVEETDEVTALVEDSLVVAFVAVVAVGVSVET